MEKPKLKTRLATGAINLCEFIMWAYGMAFSHMGIPIAAEQPSFLPSIAEN